MFQPPSTNPAYSATMSAPQTQIISAPATILASRQQLLASASAMQRVSTMPTGMLNAMDKNEVRKVFVKNIAEDIPDSFVESLLRECGQVLSWKRTKNEANVPVTFGYCEFETIEGVLRCMRLMNGMYLYGKSLEVKFSEKTQLFIRDFYDIKKRELQNEALAKGRELSDKEAGEELMRQLTQEDERAIKLMKMLIETFDLEEYKQQKERENEKKDPKKERERNREKLKIALQKDLEKKFQDKLKWWKKMEQEIEKRKERESERDKDLSREQRKALAKELEYSSDEEAERYKTPAGQKRLEERRLARQREEEEDEAERRKEEIMRSAPSLPQELHPNEIEKKKRYEKEIEIIGIPTKAKRKASVESDQGSMGALEDKVKNMKVEDIMKKQTETTLTDKKSVDQAMSDGKVKSNGVTLPDKSDKKQDEKKRERSRSKRDEKPKRKHASSSRESESSESRERTKRKRKHEKSESESVKEGNGKDAKKKKESDRKSKERKDKQDKSKERKTKDKRSKEKKEEKKDKRNKDDKSKERKKTKDEKSRDHKDKKKKRDRSSESSTSEDEKQQKLEFLKELLRKVPQKRSDIYNYKIDWDLVEKHNILKEKILPWVKQKSVELLGEEEGVFINAIMSKLMVKESAHNIEAKIEKALEEKAEDVVCKLFRTLIFECLKAKYHV